MKRFLFTLFLLAVLVFGAIYFIGKAAPDTRLDGVGMGSSIHLLGGVEGLSTSFDRVSSLGIDWVREEIPWNMVQIMPGEFRWSTSDGNIHQDFDALFTEAKAHKMKVLAVLDGGPVFLAHVYPGMPVNSEELLNAWQVYVQAVVDRYGDKISAWEIGNDENTSAGWGRVLFPTAVGAEATPDPVLYARMLQAASTIIKEKDGNAIVLLGGLEMADRNCSGNPYSFLGAIQQAGAWSFFDAIGIHIYRGDTLPDENMLLGTGYDKSSGACNPMAQRIGTLMDELDQLDSFSAQLGGKPVWITEMGIRADDLQRLSANDPSFASRVESNFVAKSVVPLLANGSVEKVFWFSLLEDPQNPGFALGPFGQITLANLSHFLKGSQPLGRVKDSTLPDDISEFAFTRDGKTILILWSTFGSGEWVTLSGLQGDTAIAYAADSAEISSATAQKLAVSSTGSLQIQVTDKSVIIVTKAGDLIPQAKSFSQDKLAQAKDAVDAGTKSFWDNVKSSISRQVSTWLNDLKDSIVQSVQKKLDQTFK